MRLGLYRYFGAGRRLSEGRLLLTHRARPLRAPAPIPAPSRGISADYRGLVVVLLLAAAEAVRCAEDVRKAQLVVPGVPLDQRTEVGLLR